MDASNSLWRATAVARNRNEPLSEAIKVDVAIVGAGFTGLRAALLLAEAGTDTAVFEAGEVAHGASGRSGGQVNPMLPLARPDDLRHAVGPKYFERMADASLKSADELFDLVRRYQIECDARQNGWIRADHCDSARTVSQANAKLWNAHGAGFEFLDGSEVEQKTGAVGYVSGTLSPRGGAVHPLSLTLGLERVAIGAGARIFTKSHVSAMHRANGMWRLQVNGHDVLAEKVIVATNGYSDSLVPKLKTSILPLTPIQIATEPLENARLDPLLKEGHTISDTRRLIMYCRREPGGEFVYGGIGYRKLAGGTGGFQWLYRDAERIFPSLRGVKWKYRWGGSIALTPDRVPHLHEPAPGLIAGLGYNGRGVAMSLVIGREMAERTLGKPMEDLSFPVTPIKRYKFRLPQVLGAGTAMKWMRFRDEMEALFPS